MHALQKEKVLVVGLGEIGRPIFELIKESGEFNVYGIDVDEKKMMILGSKARMLPSKVGIMHVCIPCASKDRFVETIFGYVTRFKPHLTIINSTVPPGTTMEVNELCKCLTAHSPVRGVHKNLKHMKWEFKRWHKYIGGVDKKSGLAAKRHFERIGLSTKVLKSSIDTELAKLFETTYRAWMIACFQEMHRISMSLGADFDDAVDFLGDTHRVRLDRPIMFPGVIGGHCLIPNVKLLQGIRDSKFLRLIIESNKEREKEIQNKEVLRQAEKVRKRAENLQSELMQQLKRNRKP